MTRAYLNLILDLRRQLVDPLQRGKAESLFNQVEFKEALLLFPHRHHTLKVWVKDRHHPLHFNHQGPSGHPYQPHSRSQELNLTSRPCFCILLYQYTTLSQVTLLIRMWTCR